MKNGRLPVHFSLVTVQFRWCNQFYALWNKL